MTRQRSKPSLILYNYFRSGTSHRLRIALNLKGIQTKYVAIDLRAEQHLQEEFKEINPQQLVPALESNGEVLIQSPSIIEWLEEIQPSPPLLPKPLHDRAHVRALASIVGCDVHPLNNRRVLEYLRNEFSAGEDVVNKWCGRWISSGFDAYEALLSADTARRGFSFGSTPTIADVYLIPQIESARRFKVDLSRWPMIMAVDAVCNSLEAFRLAAPKEQPDAK